MPKEHRALAFLEPTSFNSGVALSIAREGLAAAQRKRSFID